MEILDAIEELENVNAYLYSIEALMEKIFDIKVAKMWDQNLNKFQKFAPDLLNIDKLILNRLFHQIPDLRDKNKFKQLFLQYHM